MVHKLIARYCQLLSLIIVICLFFMVLMVFGNVVMRYAFNSGITVSEELSRWLFLWLIFLGASVAVHEQAHMGSDMVMEKLPPKLQKVGAVIGQLLMLWVTVLIFKGSWAQTVINWEVQAPVTEFRWPGCTAPGWCFLSAPGSCCSATFGSRCVAR
jgi:TRAP-type C4-dicarboxylate transport system permease small subunit